MRAESIRAAGPQVVRQDTAGREAAATVVLVVGPVIELFLVIKMARDVTGSKGRSVFTGLGTAIATYLQTAGKGKIRKLYPSKRRNSKNYIRPNGLRYVVWRLAVPWLLIELIFAGLAAAIATSHVSLTGAQVMDWLRFVLLCSVPPPLPMDVVRFRVLQLVPPASSMDNFRSFVLRSVPPSSPMDLVRFWPWMC